MWHFLFFFSAPFRVVLCVVAFSVADLPDSIRVLQICMYLRFMRDIPFASCARCRYTYLLGQESRRWNGWHHAVTTGADESSRVDDRTRAEVVARETFRSFDFML